MKVTYCIILSRQVILPSVEHSHLRRLVFVRFKKYLYVYSFVIDSILRVHCIEIMFSFDQLKFNIMQLQKKYFQTYANDHWIL